MVKGTRYLFRKRMLDDIKTELHELRSIVGQDRLSDRVMAVMQEVPRHEFVPDDLQRRAYDNGALAIGHGQTISQPFMVALMTDLLKPQAEHTILEVGTGSGYQAAILAKLVKQVYSVEIIDELAAQAAQRLQNLGVSNVEVHHANGYQGWPAQAPYDGIIVTAAAPFIPSALIEQLKPGARLVIPVGQLGFSQELFVIEKQADGSTTSRSVLGVVFVPLVDRELVSIN